MELTEEKIISENFLIAEFMDDITDTGQEPAFVPFKGKGYELHELEYHKSWDWLMPVVEKIESLEKWEFDIFGKHLEISYGGKFSLDEISFHRDTKIEAVWIGTVAFIKWYNKESKQKE